MGSTLTEKQYILYSYYTTGFSSNRSVVRPFFLPFSLQVPSNSFFQCDYSGGFVKLTKKPSDLGVTHLFVSLRAELPSQYNNTYYRLAIQLGTGVGTTNFYTDYTLPSLENGKPILYLSLSFPLNNKVENIYTHVMKRNNYNLPNPSYVIINYLAYS